MAPSDRRDNRSELNICIAAEKHTYHPGELIDGELTLNLPSDSPIGKVSLVFLGQARSKIRQSNGQSTSTFNSDVQLFRYEKVLQDDHFTHRLGNYNWSFKFEIPEAVVVTDVTGQWVEHDNFLSNVIDDYAHSVPASFGFTSFENTKRYDVAVSYTLEATITPPHSAYSLAHKVRVCTKSIRVTPNPSTQPVDLDDPRYRQGHMTRWTIKALRLLPEDLNSWPLLRLTKARLQPSTWPKLTVDIDVSYPSVLQLSHSETIPFILSVRPNTDPDLTSIQPTMQTFYRYPTVYVKRFQLTLEMITECRCNSLLRDVHAGSVRKIELANRQFPALSFVMTSVAWDQKNRVENDAPPMIDIGRECEVRLKMPFPTSANNGMKGQNPQLGLAPSLKTYNISRKYHFAWTIELVCAGEKFFYSDRSTQQIYVFGPAQSLQNGILTDESALTLGLDEEDTVHDDNSMRDNDPTSHEGIQRLSNRDTLPAYSELPGSSATILQSTPQRSKKARRM